MLGTGDDIGAGAERLALFAIPEALAPRPVVERQAWARLGFGGWHRRDLRPCWCDRAGQVVARASIHAVMADAFHAMHRDER